MNALGTALLAPIVLAVSLEGCSAGPVVTVANLSASPLTNVVVSNGAREQRIGEVSPGAKSTVALQTRGEELATLAFDADGRHFDSAGKAYVEGSGGYQVTFSVKPDFQVTAVTDLKGY